MATEDGQLRPTWDNLGKLLAAYPNCEWQKHLVIIEKQKESETIQESYGSCQWKSPSGFEYNAKVYGKDNHDCIQR